MEEGWSIRVGIDLEHEWSIDISHWSFVLYIYIYMQSSMPAVLAQLLSPKNHWKSVVSSVVKCSLVPTFRSSRLKLGFSISNPNPIETDPDSSHRRCIHIGFGKVEAGTRDIRVGSLGDGLRHWASPVQHIGTAPGGASWYITGCCLTPSDVRIRIASIPGPYLSLTKHPSSSVVHSTA